MKNFLNGVIINLIIFQTLSKEFLSERIVKFHREVTCFVDDHMITQLLAYWWKTICWSDCKMLRQGESGRVEMTVNYWLRLTPHPSVQIIALDRLIRLTTVEPILAFESERAELRGWPKRDLSTSEMSGWEYSEELISRDELCFIQSSASSLSQTQNFIAFIQAYH